MKKHTRRVYGAFDIIGELGGVLELIVLFFSFFVNPIAEQAFLLTTGRFLFFARCDEHNLFVPSSNIRVEKLVESGILGH